jgi:hypothetical protein
MPTYQQTQRILFLPRLMPGTPEVQRQQLTAVPPGRYTVTLTGSAAGKT